MRTSGILMHISSLPSPYGIGTMGKEAYKFIDFLKDAKQHYWQILPVCPTSYGDSPYQSFSTHAGNPYFIDFDILTEEGLLSKSDYSKINWGENPEKADYEKLYNNRFKVLRKAYNNFKSTDKTDFYKFLDENEHWISNYALFMAIKDEHNGKCWLEWDEPLKMRDSHALWCFKEAHMDEVEFWEFVQYEFYCQWQKLKKYAKENNVEIIGDLPIYVAMDSADVWVSPDLFDLDEELNPKTVAGCPPDGFSADGQLWGNPIYNWQRHKETNFQWWIDRMTSARKLYDVIRIDHFRGFDEFYTIPYGDKTARQGHWEKGPGIELFNAISQKLGNIPIIAEDLGFMTESVKELLKNSGFPGMKVLEFAFDPREESDYLPYNYDKNSVVYIGTHDNAPAKAWIDELDKETLKFCKDFIGCNSTDISEFIDTFIKVAFATVSDTCIIQMQDYLELGAESRMNTPAVPYGNWQWRMKKGATTKTLAKRIAHITQVYGRAER